MLVVGFPAGQLQANCYLLAREEDAPCVIVDPGQDVLEGLAEQLAKHRLTPEAVLLTHGHFDHAFSARQVCELHHIPAWIHPADRPLLDDPLRGLSADAAAFFGGRLEMSEPEDVRELAGGDVLELAGLRLDVDHTPGHTGGSVCFRTGPVSETANGRLLFSGDTLFAGSIGRTDLPGGDTEQIMESLRTKLVSLPEDTVVLPGHGPTTTIGRERAGNPFLAGLSTMDGAAQAPAAPHRGL